MDRNNTSELSDDYEKRQNISSLLEQPEDTGSEIIMADGGEFEGFDRFKDKSEKYEKFRSKYERLMEKHIETQEELNNEIRNEHERVIEEYGDLIEFIEELDEEYAELDDKYIEALKKYENAADRIIYTLEDFSEAERSNGAKDAVQGGLFFAAGLISADQYSFGGPFEFYANAAMNYANDPETAILTLGLPLIGVWFFKNAFESWGDARELSNAADVWKERKADIPEPEKERSSSRFDEIDRIEF